VDDEGFSQSYRTASCAEQVRIAERTWWLSDPLYSIDGNERRSDHLARQVELILMQGYREHRLMTPAMARAEKGLDPSRPMVVSPSYVTNDITMSTQESVVRQRNLVALLYGFPELVLRLGPPMYFAREESTESRIALYPKSRASFVPAAHAIADPVHAVPEDWEVNNPFAFEFMSDWPQPVRDIEYQVAYFRRGDFARVVGGTDVSRDTLLMYSELVGSLVFQRDHDAPVHKQERMGRGLVAFDVITPAESSLVSFEVMERSGITGRARFGAGPTVMPAQRFSVSDILLTTPGLPVTDLMQAGFRTLGTTRLLTGSTVGVFWEMYGLAAGETPSVSLVVAPTPTRLLGRIANALTLRRAADTVQVTWQEPAVAGATEEARSINLDLSALRAGDYTLSLSLQIDGQEAVVSQRRLQVREPMRYRQP
jgi:hypothetical protein